MIKMLVFVNVESAAFISREVAGHGSYYVYSML
jgi:hypothetical protein